MRDPWVGICRTRSHGTAKGIGRLVALLENRESVDPTAACFGPGSRRAEDMFGRRDSILATGEALEILTHGSLVGLHRPPALTRRSQVAGANAWKNLIE